MARKEPRTNPKGGGADAFTTESTPEPPVDAPYLDPVPGPQADALEPGRVVPGNPRSPSNRGPGKGPTPEGPRGGTPVSDGKDEPRV